MAGKSFFSIFGNFVRERGRKRPVPVINFQEGELITRPEELSIPWYGEYLNLPMTTAAIVTSSEGRRKVYTEGSVLYDAPGKYKVQYVDLRQRILTVSVKTTAQDSWTVSLSVSIIYQVGDPLQISMISQPYVSLVDQCKTALSNFIHSQPFANLVTTPGGLALTDAQIATAILQTLCNNPALTAFKFINLNSRERSGDPRRTEKIQEAMVQQTANEQTLLNQVEKLKLEKEVMQQELALSKEHEILLVQQAHAERMRDEEKDRIKLTQAEIEARASEILYSARMRSIELDRLSAEQHIQFVEVIKAMELYSAAFGQMAQMLAQVQMTPGLQQSLQESQAFDHLAQAFESLSRIMPGEVTRVPPPIITSSSLKEQPDNAEPKVLPAVRTKHLSD